MSAAAGEGRINVRRNVTSTTTLTSVSGAPARRASMLLFMNDGTAAGSAEFTGDDGTTVTVALGIDAYIELCGDFETVGTLSADVTCVAGWVDDGSVIRNA